MAVKKKLLVEEYSQELAAWIFLGYGCHVKCVTHGQTNPPWLHILTHGQSIKPSMFIWLGNGIRGASWLSIFYWKSDGIWVSLNIYADITPAWWFGIPTPLKNMSSLVGVTIPIYYGKS
jgi:hypothetical protein